MIHTIKFKTAAELIAWLAENDINELAVDLTIHIQE
jgi:hypothetical protein